MKEKAYQSKPLLTKREREVFELLVQDKTTKEIAGELFISEKTVRNHISNAMQKLGVKGRSQAVVEPSSYGRASSYKKKADFYKRVGYFFAYILNLKRYLRLGEGRYVKITVLEHDEVCRIGIFVIYK